jgi:hypothetical protein
VLVNEQASAVSADANVGEGADLILGQRDVHRVAFDPGDGPDRDSDLLPSGNGGDGSGSRSTTDLSVTFTVCSCPS